MSAIRNQPIKPMAAISIFLVAGEASGDKHAAHLVQALRRLRPEIKWHFVGAGREEMRAAGVELTLDTRELAIMGVLEVAQALPKFLRVFRQLRAAARQQKPDLVILIDWPEFNLRLAKALKRDGQRVAYYISPQLWGWRSGRIKLVRQAIERMLVILPFEQEYYAQRGVAVEYVGNPLLDSVQVTATRAEFCLHHQLDAARPLVALLPGSRRTEMQYILPPLLDAATRLHLTHPLVQFVLPLARTFARSELPALPLNVRVIEKDTYNALAAADLAVVASGTATLETAIIGTPLLVVYRASALNWRIFRPLIKVPFVGMPNLIAGREIAPELLQDDLNGERLAGEIATWLADSSRLQQAREDLQEVRQKLGEANASQRAAEAILQLLTGLKSES